MHYNATIYFILFIRDRFKAQGAGSGCICMWMLVDVDLIGWIAPPVQQWIRLIYGFNCGSKRIHYGNFDGVQWKGLIYIRWIQKDPWSNPLDWTSLKHKVVDLDLNGKV
jgi:hypothetical protein